MPGMDEMKRDMRTLKSQGFNLIKLQESWFNTEPVEGRLDLDPYRKLIEYAQKLDMGVYFGLTCEQAPLWLWEKYPDAHMVDAAGRPVFFKGHTPLPADAKPGPCFDHPGALDAQNRYIEKLVRALSEYENIVVWNTWQEVGYWSERLVGTDVCFCENTVAAFREWLKQKYGALDALNRAWGSAYADWMYVRPDAMRRMKSGIPNHVDWNYFIDDVKIARTLAGRAEIIRRADPLGRPVFAHKEAPNVGTGRAWRYAPAQDFLGCSLYPAWHPAEPWDDIANTGARMAKDDCLAYELWDSVVMMVDYMRSYNRRGAPVWVAELQGGPISTGLHLGRVPAPEDVNRWMLGAVGAGATALSFWVTRAEIMALELNGFSLLDSEGDTTPRLEEAGRVGRALNRHPALFATANQPKAKAAILVDEWNHQVLRDIHRGAEQHAYSMRGWHRHLFQNGIPVDFLEISQLEGNEDYQTLILPFPLSLGEDRAEALGRYVEAGGHLIVEACPGRLNEHAIATRGEMSPVLKKVLGVRHKGLRLVDEPGGGGRWSFEERGWGEFEEPCFLMGAGDFAGYALRASFYIETFAPEGAEPILTWKEQAVATRNAWGRGGAILLGTLAGHSATAYRDPESAAFIRAMLHSVGLRPEHAGTLHLRKRVNSDCEGWFFFNPTAEAVTEMAEAPGFMAVEDLWGNPKAVVDGRVEVNVPSHGVEVLILTRA